MIEDNRSRAEKLRALANRTENPHEAAAFHERADAIERKGHNIGAQFAEPRPSTTVPQPSSRVSQGTGAWRNQAPPSRSTGPGTVYKSTGRGRAKRMGRG